MLTPRVLTALIGIPIVTLIVVVGGPLFFGVALLLSFIALYELDGATRAAKTPLLSALAYPLLFMVMTTPLLQMGNNPILPKSVGLWPGLPGLMALLLLGWAVAFYPKPERVTLVSVALTLLSIFYVGLFVFLPLLRALPHGNALMWLTLLGVWTGDTIAYYAGRAWGRVKLTPLSPGKTREGALAGLAGTIAMCALVAWQTHLGLGHGIALGVLISLVAPLGDLAESFWKRELDVKDLGNLLPGHGGVLDRCDSLLFAACVVYCYATVLMLR